MTDRRIVSARFSTRWAASVSVGARALATCLVLAVALGMPWRATTQVQPGSRILVMPFAAEVGQDAPAGPGASLWLGEAAAVLIGDELSNLGIDALAREERVAAFDRLQLPMSSALTRATMIRVAELVGASDVVFGAIRLGPERQDLEVHARIVHLETGREQPAVSDGSPLTEIFSLFARVAGRVAELSGAPVPTGVSPVTPLPLDVFENYVKGLVAATPASQRRFLETARGAAPADPRVLMALWNVYTTQGLYEEALAAANTVPADSGLWTRARLGVAESLIALQRLDGAFEESVALYEQRPTARVANVLGVVQLRRGDPDGTEAATAYFGRAVELEPGNADYLFNLGYAHARSGQVSEALDRLRETVRYNPADGDARLVMSAALAMAGEPSLARRQLQLASMLGASVPVSDGEPIAEVPDGLERLRGDFDSARVVGVATSTQRDQRDTAAFYLAQGEALFDEGRDREAAEALHRALYLSPDDAEAHLLLGRVYRRTGQTAAAIDEFKIAIWSSESALAHLALGAALFDEGDLVGARRAAERALQLAPGSAEARDLLARTTQ